MTAGELPDQTEYVYLIGNPDQGVLKIGRSINVGQRVSAIQGMSPVPLMLLWKTPGGSALEAALHSHFKDRRIHGEWFNFTGVNDPVAMVTDAVGKLGEQTVDPTSPWQMTTRTHRVPAPMFVAERLPAIVEGEPVYACERIVTLAGTIVERTEDSYFALSTGEVWITADDAVTSHLARIDAVSPVLEVQEELRARMPTGPEASRLKIPQGTPVVEVIRTLHTVSGPLDVTRSVIRGDMAAFDYRFPVPD